MNDEDIKAIKIMMEKCKNCEVMWSEHYVPVTKIKEEIEHLGKNIKDIENATLLKARTLREQMEIEVCKYAICVLTRLLEGK